jgi:hypothetical protein
MSLPSSSRKRCFVRTSDRLSHWLPPATRWTPVVLVALLKKAAPPLARTKNWLTPLPNGLVLAPSANTNEPPPATALEPRATLFEPVARDDEPKANAASPLLTDPRPPANVYRPLAVVANPRAVLPPPLAVVTSPRAALPSPLAVLPSPTATLPNPTCWSSQLCPSARPARNAALPGYHIMRTPGPLAGIGPWPSVPPATTPPSGRMTIVDGTDDGSGRGLPPLPAPGVRTNAPGRTGAVAPGAAEGRRA